MNTKFNENQAHNPISQVFEKTSLLVFSKWWSAQINIGRLFKFKWDHTKNLAIRRFAWLPLNKVRSIPYVNAWIYRNGLCAVTNFPWDRRAKAEIWSIIYKIPVSKFPSLRPIYNLQSHGYIHGVMQDKKMRLCDWAVNQVIMFVM